MLVNDLTDSQRMLFKTLAWAKRIEQRRVAPEDDHLLRIDTSNYQPIYPQKSENRIDSVTSDDGELRRRAYELKDRRWRGIYLSFLTDAVFAYETAYVSSSEYGHDLLRRLVCESYSSGTNEAHYKCCFRQLELVKEIVLRMQPHCN